MCIYKKITIAVLVLALILCGSFSVCAADEDINWDDIEWNGHLLYEYFNSEHRASLESWLRKLDYSKLFYFSTITDGAVSDWYSGIVFDRFVEDPYGLIQALALEEAVMQKNVMGSIVYGSDWRNFGQFLGNIRLPQSATPTEKAILAEIIRITRDEFYIDVPYTHDPIALPAALLLLSAAGIVCLTKRKRVV
ncbi:MAG: hypothetical protein IJ448_05915 [Oscillospiraceae bacterium]|nr:hypothetical protein [Oscillospiraceae bacterium]